MTERGWRRFEAAAFVCVYDFHGRALEVRELGVFVVIRWGQRGVSFSLPFYNSDEVHKVESSSRFFLSCSLERWMLLFRPFPVLYSIVSRENVINHALLVTLLHHHHHHHSRTNRWGITLFPLLGQSPLLSSMRLANRTKSSFRNRFRPIWNSLACNSFNNFAPNSFCAR